MNESVILQKHIKRKTVCKDVLREYEYNFKILLNSFIMEHETFYPIVKQVK